MQDESPKPEVWLRGPVPEIPALLQPVAHALLQACEEVEQITKDLPTALLWIRPAGLAAPGFHLQHLSGVLDRLLTYAREESLNQTQLDFLKNEGKETYPGQTASDLFIQFKNQVNSAINQLKTTDVSTLTEVRFVGRGKIPSTHIGLLFHAAEHTQRHVGQLLVTAKILTSQGSY